ncbi:MAG: flagellar basal body P-ring protein FlgI [Phycisphaerales bacterium]|nr:flagellar basal body P-ring protein FlgI [Phycisphaerales bacterium]
MTRMVLRLAAVSAAVVLALRAGPADASTIQDMVRIQGQQEDVLIGMGIVVGLDGTGDRAKDVPVAARPYAQLLKNLGNPVLGAKELDKVDSSAIVMVTLRVPPAGAREGDRIDISVESMFSATSLAGGRLVPSLLRLPLPDSANLAPMAFASGPITVDGTNPRAGTVPAGGQMLVDVFTSPIQADGTMALVLKDQFATYPVATMIADTINDVFATQEGTTGMARAMDSKTVRVALPAPAQRDPATFISQLMTIYVDPSLLRLPARVVINARQGIILATDNVEIGPVAVTHSGLSITTITPEPTPTPDNPAIAVTRWTGLGTVERPGRNATLLRDLLKALDRLAVPVADQIAIIHELQRSGALRAEVIVQ